MGDTANSGAHFFLNTSMNQGWIANLSPSCGSKWTYELVAVGRWFSVPPWHQSCLRLGHSLLCPKSLDPESPTSWALRSAKHVARKENHQLAGFRKCWKPMDTIVLRKQVGVPVNLPVLGDKNHPNVTAADRFQIIQMHKLEWKSSKPHN